MVVLRLAPLGLAQHFAQQASRSIPSEVEGHSTVWRLYILQCRNGDLYTGITTDVERRVREHQAGQGGRFTRAMRPVKLLYQEGCETEQDAKRREAQVKAWSRTKKLALISGNPNVFKST